METPKDQRVRITAFPPGPGPFERWEVTVEATGEVILSGATCPIDVQEIHRACNSHWARAHTSPDTARPQWLLEQEAAAYREMAPYIGRLQSISQRLGRPLGQLLIRSAVEQLEQDHRSAGRSIN